ncbi:MAG: MG2 domain-containing protein [Bacteroidota bacterium]
MTKPVQRFNLFVFILIVAELLSSAFLTVWSQEVLRVISATPRGLTETRDQSRMVVVMFSKPMVPLRSVEGELYQESGPLIIEPAVKGKYRWLGTSTLTFVPFDTLPFATEYRVKVPAGLKALDGSALEHEYIWTFQTPRPVLVRSIPEDGAKFVELNQLIYLQFNQPVNPERAKSFIELRQQNGAGPRSLPFALRYPSKREMSKEQWSFSRKYVLVVDPSERFQRGTAYSLILRAGLIGAAGTLGMVRDTSIQFTTYNEFRFEGLLGDTGKLAPENPLEFRFSNPVRISDFVRHLHFTPAVKIPERYSEYTYYDAHIFLSLPLLPATRYTVRIDKSLADLFRQTLGKEVTFTFTTVDYLPFVSMVTGQGLLESYGDLQYPLTVRNVDAVRLRIASLQVDDVIPLLVHDDLFYTGRSYDALSFKVDRMWELPLRRNVLARLPVQLGEVLSPHRNGFIFLEISTVENAPESRQHFKAFLQVTGLGITAKFSPENTLIWATRLRDASPVAKAEVQLRDDKNRILWRGKTDEAGLAKAPGWGPLGVRPPSWWQQPRLWVFVKHNHEYAFTRTEEGTGIEPWRFGIDYEWRPKFQPLEGAIFTDRGLYRAGEKVHIKGIFRKRTQDVWSIPRRKVVLVRIRDPRNEVVKKDSLPLSEYGSFAFDLKLKPTAHLGYYNIEALIPRDVTGEDNEEQGYFDLSSADSDNRYEVIATNRFRVEAFRPVEFEVKAKSWEPSYTVGDTFRGCVEARYLSGTPMRNEKVTWRIHTRPSSYEPPGHEGFSFGSDWWFWEDEEYSPEEGFTTSQDTALDEHGIFNVSCPLPVGQILQTSSLLFEADVTSPSRRVVSGRTNVLLHGGEYYIGIRRSSSFLRVGDTLRYAIIAVRPNGELMAAESLTVKVIRREWNSVRKAGADGRYYWVTEHVDSVIGETHIRSGDSAIEAQFVPQRAGLYFVTAEGQDVRGNMIRTIVHFYVSGTEYVAWKRSDDDRIELVADAERYQPGNVAHIIVKSPYEKARALITVERDGIIKEWVTVLEGSAPELSLPITNAYLPNVFVSVVLLQGRVASNHGPSESEDLGRPSFKIGYINLPVDAGAKHLNVTVVTDKETYRPGDSVSVTIDVRDEQGSGAASEAVVSVADVGVLNLIGYQLPDPFAFFYGSRPLAVNTSETIAHLVEQRSYGEKGEDVGGGGGVASLAGIEMRGQFRLTAYWNASLKTDDSGRATIRFKLPDNLTQFKVMVVAQTKGSEFGMGSSTFRVNKELLLRGALPRFARLGDSFEAGIVTTNSTGKPGRIRLLAKASGGVRLQGVDTVEFELKPEESKEIRFSFLAQRVSPARFDFHASMESLDSVRQIYTDGLTLTIPIEVPRMKESVALFESARDSAMQAIVIPKNIYPRLGELEFTMSSTALSGLEQAVEYLFEYPYGCLEQQISRILPIILGREMVDAFHLRILRGKDTRAVAQKVLDEIGQYQTEDGGFSYWKGDQHPSPYVTAYTLYVLAEANLRGYNIDSDVITSAVQYCKRFLRNRYEQVHNPYTRQAWLSVKALMVYALALLHNPEPAYIEQLFQSRNDLPLFAKAYLLKAIHASTKSSTMELEIVRDLMNSIKVSSTTAHFEEPDWEGLQWVFSTNTRTTAIILQALLEIGMRDSFLSRIARWIMDEQRIGRWRSTQENAYVVNALQAYFNLYEREAPDFKAQITVAKKRLLGRIFRGRELSPYSKSVKLTSFPAEKQLPVVISKSGQGTLYYGIRMNYYPRRDSLPRDEGIAILKTISPIGGSPQSSGKFGAGLVYKVTLTVVTPQERHFVVVDDPLPAGFEAINLSFETESRQLAQGLHNEDVNNEYDDYWWGGFNHVEQKDDRVLIFADALLGGVHTYSYLVRATTYGTFGMPATHAEQMYEPEVFGRTVGKIIVVQ